MADKKDTVWLNVKDWQVKSLTKQNKEGKEYEAYIITLGVDKCDKPNEKDQLIKGGSLDGYATIEVRNVVQKDGGRYSVPLDPNKIYAERYVKNIKPEAQVDKKGEPVINPKTGKQYDLKEMAYRQLTGAAIVERENARYERYKAEHPEVGAKEAPAEPAKAAADTPLDKSEVATSLEDLTFE